MKILYIMSSYNLYGGTPKKTLDLMKHFRSNSVLYIYHDSYSEFKHEFEATGASIYEGFYGRNVFKHVKHLLKIIDEEKIDIVQTQFSMGETFGYFLKKFRPNIKLVVAFVTPFKPTYFKSKLLPIFYKNVDVFVYITNYVKKAKENQFPVLKRKVGKMIFNGTERRIDNGEVTVSLKKNSLFDIAGLSDWKNIQILIEALHIIVNVKNRKDVYLYVAGDGPMRESLEKLIDSYQLKNHVFLLGYQSNVGKLLNDCDVFVHSAYAEGFGIVIPEAMLAKKPIIVSNAGALPELIMHEESGLIVDPFKAEEWSNAILRIIDDSVLSEKLALNAVKRAKQEFTKDVYVKNYETVYRELVVL